MKSFTGYEYLLIDIANQMGHDKMLFDDRIKWATEHLQELESLADEAECQPLYLKAVMALRKAQRGIPTGHLIELDACCSGLQIMSALTGCVSGATATGLVDPNVRADAYTIVTDTMNTILNGGVNVSRKDAKRAVMTTFYGSKLTPKEIFGEDTPEINAFYQATNIVAPGAWELLQDLLASWQPYALVHSWKLPDGYDARVKVMDKITARVEVDELDHATFTYEFYENVGSKTGLSNAANVIHSIDAYVLRSMHRRCNYNLGVVLQASTALRSEIDMREQGYTSQLTDYIPEEELAYYVEQYERSGMADVVVLPFIKDGHQTQYLSDEYLMKLLTLCNQMLMYKSFELVTIHDAFKAHSNNCNAVRQQYINIMAELSESRILDDILSQIHGEPGCFPKLSTNLGELIRDSNYALS